MVVISQEDVGQFRALIPQPELHWSSNWGFDGFCTCERKGFPVGRRVF